MPYVSLDNEDAVRQLGRTALEGMMATRPAERWSSTLRLYAELQKHQSETDEERQRRDDLLSMSEYVTGRTQMGIVSHPGFAPSLEQHQATVTEAMQEWVHAQPAREQRWQGA